jgi:hypothetical protein
MSIKYKGSAPALATNHRWHMARSCLCLPFATGLLAFVISGCSRSPSITKGFDVPTHTRDRQRFLWNAGAVAEVAGYVESRIGGVDSSPRVDTAWLLATLGKPDEFHQNFELESYQYAFQTDKGTVWLSVRAEVGHIKSVATGVRFEAMGKPSEEGGKSRESRRGRGADGGTSRESLIESGAVVERTIGVRHQE